MPQAIIYYMDQEVARVPINKDPAPVIAYLHEHYTDSALAACVHGGYAVRWPAGVKPYPHPECGGPKPPCLHCNATGTIVYDHHPYRTPQVCPHCMGSTRYNHPQ